MYKKDEERPVGFADVKAILDLLVEGAKRT